MTQFVNMRNVETQIARVDTDEMSSVWIGGGRSNAASQVGEEFADITGGGRINFGGRHGNELIDLFAALTTSSGNEAPELEGVTLVSVTADSFVIMFEGWLGSKNYIEFTGSAAEAAIKASLSNIVNTDNSESQFTIFDTDVVSNIFVGDDRDTSDEVQALQDGSKLGFDEMDAFFFAATSGREKNDTGGLDGVELIGLTDEGFTLRIEGQGETVDTIVFKGAEAVEAITERDAAEGNFDRKDGNWGFDVFDVANESSQNVTDNASFGFGNKITPDEVLALFNDLTSGNARQYDTGINGVELIGLNDSSFSVAVTTSGGNKDFILFTNVNTLEGSDDYGFDAPVPPVDDVPTI